MRKPVPLTSEAPGHAMMPDQGRKPKECSTRSRAKLKVAEP